MLNPVETNINKRWEEGTPHHPKSEELFKFLQDADWKYLDGYFDFRSGGDGDSGEQLMYLMDIYFETKDNALHI